jgi:hypothetical protein
VVVAGGVRRKLCPELVDTSMDRAPFVRHFAFPGLRQLARKRAEAVVQLAPEGRDFHFALLELFELDCKCVQIWVVAIGHG